MEIIFRGRLKLWNNFSVGNTFLGIIKRGQCSGVQCSLGDFSGIILRKR